MVKKGMSVASLPPGIRRVRGRRGPFRLREDVGREGPGDVQGRTQSRSAARSGASAAPVTRR